MLDINHLPILKAITLWQPWASLWAYGAKEFETRSWKTEYRGPIAIHSAAMSIKRVLKECFPLGDWSYHPDYYARTKFLNAVGNALLTPMDQLPFGCIIATAELVGCHKMVSDDKIGTDNRILPCLKTDNGIYIPTEQELMFGNWSPGRYAWEIKNVKILDIPIPAKGAQSLWNCKIGLM